MLSRQYEDGNVDGEYDDPRLWDLDTEYDRENYVAFEHSLQSMQAEPTGVRRSARLKTQLKESVGQAAAAADPVTPFQPIEPKAKRKKAKAKPTKPTRQEKATAARLEEEGGLPSDDELNLDEDHRRCLHEAMTDYSNDTFFSKVLADVDDHDRFHVKDGALWNNNEVYGDRLCIASGLVDGRKARKIVHAHELSGHAATRRMIAIFNI